MRKSLLAVVVSTAYGVVIATGVLTILSVIAASLRGYNLGELYLDIFPRYRGPSGVTPIPPFVYAIFFAYVVGAAEIAILYRRRIAKRWER